MIQEKFTGATISTTSTSTSIQTTSRVLGVASSYSLETREDVDYGLNTYLKFELRLSASSEVPTCTKN